MSDTALPVKNPTQTYRNLTQRSQTHTRRTTRHSHSHKHYTTVGQVETETEQLSYTT
jgi:hypothetical protein